jgi:hypothetical protein
MSPEEFDEVMRQLSCACCDSTMEVTYVNDVPFHQGGVLLQKVPAMKQGVAGWAVIKQALCSNCLEQLQALANYHKAQEEGAEAPTDTVVTTLRRKPGVGALVPPREHGPFYVCGGEYEDYEKEGCPPYFAVISPHGKCLRPYVARSKEAAAKLFHIVRHHGHLYELADDLKTATLVEASREATGVGCPAAVEVPPPWRKALCDTINLGDFSGEW